MSSHARNRAVHINRRARARSDWSRLTSQTPPLCYKYGVARWNDSSKEFEGIRAVFISDTAATISSLADPCIA